MKNTADVTGGKPIAILLQSISGVSALVAFNDINGRKREVLFYFLRVGLWDSILGTRMLFTSCPDCSRTCIICFS
jgi:hypothetical protein